MTCRYGTAPQGLRRGSADLIDDTGQPPTEFQDTGRLDADVASDFQVSASAGRSQSALQDFVKAAGAV
jgi:hypothetical protein